MALSMLWSSWECDLQTRREMTWLCQCCVDCTRGILGVTLHYTNDAHILPIEESSWIIAHAVRPAIDLCGH